jgi:hypothetical protein
MNDWRNGMYKLTLTCFLLLFAGLIAGAAPAGAAEAGKRGKQEAVETGAGGQTVRDRDADSGISTEAGAGLEEAGESNGKVWNATEEQERKEFVSVRRKKKPFTFQMGFSIGGIGYGVLGPRSAREDRYQFQYLKQSFMAGFRGGLEAFFSPAKRHWISVGAYYEQRRVQFKVGDLAIARLLFPALTPQEVYYLPVARYVDKSNVDTNYITLPVGYRFHVLDEFYIGLCLDVAVLFQARANYSVISYSTHLNLMKHLSPVDFGGRLVFGFTMNKVFIEIGTGCGFLDIDRMAGERHTINVIGMVGYRL